MTTAMSCGRAYEWSVSESARISIRDRYRAGKRSGYIEQENIHWKFIGHCGTLSSFAGNVCTAARAPTGGLVDLLCRLVMMLCHLQ